MQISFSGAGQANIGVLEQPLLRLHGSGSRRRDRIQERIAERERELRIREMEDLRIKRLRDEILSVKSSDMENDLKKISISSLHEQIAQIHKDRAEREQLAIERELQRQQQEMEEIQRERERKAQENRPPEDDPEEAAMRENIRGLTIISSRMDNISLKKRTRASMAAEAEQLSQDISNSYGLAHIDKGSDLSTTDRFSTKWMPIGHMNPDDFRNRHLQNLNAGISRLDMAIIGQVGAMYRDSQALQEAQLRIQRDELAQPTEDDSDDEEQAVDLIDLIL